MSRPELPTAPPIIIRIIPDEEKEGARDIKHLLGSLESYLQNFSDAVDLMDWCTNEYSRCFKTLREQVLVEANQLSDRNESWQIRKSMRTLGAWKAISARDACMTVFHFNYILGALIELLPQSPTLNALSDAAQLSGAKSLLDKHFPKAEQIRHSVAHSGELAANHAKNALQGRRSKGPFKIEKDGSVFINDCIEDRTLVITRKREMLRFDIDYTSLNKLIEVTNCVFKAFGDMHSPPIPSDRS